MLRAWCTLLIFVSSLTAPLTASSVLSHTSNGLLSIKSSNDSLVDVQIQVNAADVSLSAKVQVQTSESRIITLASAPAPTTTTFSLDHSSTTSPISSIVQNNVIISRSSSSPSLSASPKPISVIFGSDTTLAFVTDFSGAYTVPTAIMTFTVVSQDVEQNTNGSSTQPVPVAPGATSSGPEAVTSGVQVQQHPHTSIIAVITPTASATNSNSAPPGSTVNRRIDVILISILSLCSISILL